MVDLGASAARSTEITDRHRHRYKASHVIAIGRRQRLAAPGPVYLSGDPAPTTLSIVSHAVTDYVTYGDNIPGDGELGLIGDVSAGRRVIELGISGNGNAIALARLGAKAISVDPDPDRIGALRLDATDAEVWVECHEGDLGDLGFAPSGTIDVVLSVHTLDVVDDLGRILRQVHRVLKPGAPFVLVLDHPFAAVGTGPDGTQRRYGDGQRTIGELLAALDRSNFRVEVFHELGVSGESAVPTTLVIKVRKQGS